MEVEGERKAVETDAQIRAARRYVDVDHYHPSAWRTPGTVGSAEIVGVTFLPAVSGSFSPCPVRTHTIVAPGSIRPCAASLRIPATDAAEAGSTKMPSKRARSR